MKKIMTVKQLQGLLAQLEGRFGTVIGTQSEANTIATYVDGVMDALRQILGRKLRDPAQFTYVMRDVIKTSQKGS